ncbi:hypothetical protein K2X05_13675, partial [bacterium]|nr:hypothetical protein [bacterium]
MFFTLLFSTLLWQSVHAMSPEERAAEQKAIEAECKPLLADSQIIYNTCIAKGGQKAQAARKQESVNEPAKPVVCNPSGALSACEAASTRAAKINNPNAPDIEVEEAIVACLSACNPQSSKVLAAYFDDCNSSTKAYEDQMKIYLNKCGYKVSAKDQQPEEDKSLTDRAVDLLPSKAKEFLFEKGWIGGKFESDARSSFSNAYSVPLNQDIDYVKTETRDGVIYKYRSSIDGSYHDSYASAESYNKRLSGPSFGKPSLPQPPAPSSDDLDASDRGTIAERADLAPDTSPNPPPRPDDFRAPPGEGRQEPVAGGGGNGGNTSGGGGAAPQDPIARQPAPSPQPMVPGNDGAFVNNALNAPIPNNSGGGMSPVSTGDSSEVSSSGSSSSSSSGY